MWPLFSGGRTYYGYKAARSRADAAALMREGTELDVAMQARLDYIGVMREQENARVTGDLVRQTEERLRVTREEFEAGRVARFNVLRDEAELANAVQLDTAARSQAALALVALKTTLGVDLASPITATEPLQYIAERSRSRTGSGPHSRRIRRCGRRRSAPRPRSRRCARRTAGICPSCPRPGCTTGSGCGIGAMR